jgi:predicted DNA-binding antitoxin AbrB/MazE fold protein
METQTVQAIFEDGKLVPLTPLALSNREQVEVTIKRKEEKAGDEFIARPTPENPSLGLFADEPELIDEIVEEAMRIRETRPLRSSGGKDLT